MPHCVAKAEKMAKNIYFFSREKITLFLLISYGMKGSIINIPILGDWVPGNLYLKCL